LREMLGQQLSRPGLIAWVHWAGQLTLNLQSFSSEVRDRFQQQVRSFIRHKPPQESKANGAAFVHREPQATFACGSRHSLPVDGDLVRWYSIEHQRILAPLRASDDMCGLGKELPGSLMMLVDQILHR